MDTFLELANSGVKFKIRFAERRLALNYAVRRVDTWTGREDTWGGDKTSPDRRKALIETEKD